MAAQEPPSRPHVWSITHIFQSLPPLALFFQNTFIYFFSFNHFPHPLMSVEPPPRLSLIQHGQHYMPFPRG